MLLKFINITNYCTYFLFNNVMREVHKLQIINEDCKAKRKNVSPDNYKKEMLNKLLMSFTLS